MRGVPPGDASAVAEVTGAFTGFVATEGGAQLATRAKERAIVETNEAGRASDIIGGYVRPGMTI